MTSLTSVEDSRGAGTPVRRSDAGVALVLVLVFLTLFCAVAAALVSVTSMEARMVGAERARHAVRGAAEVALERALQEVAGVADWNAILSGAVRSRFIDSGPPPALGEWGALDLTAVTARLQGDTDASNQWGPDGQHWRLFLSAPLDVLLDTTASGSAGAAGSGAGGGPGGGTGSAAGPHVPVFAVVWVADDPGEGDANPGADMNGCVTVRAEAFGPFRSRKALAATVRRRGGSLEVLAWHAPDGT